MTLLVKLGLIVTGMIVGMVVISSNVRAQQVQFEQKISPFECIYTTTQTGEQETMISTCQGQPVPTVVQVILQHGRPIISGTFMASKAVALRVWLNGLWYTYGFDTRLTVDSDMWTLDLSDLAESLDTGVYTIVVEVETSDGLLLRNALAGTFSVVESLPPAPQVIDGPRIVNGGRGNQILRPTPATTFSPDAIMIDPEPFKTTAQTSSKYAASSQKNSSGGDISPYIIVAIGGVAASILFIRRSGRL